MEFIKFRVVKVVNPNTQEESTKLRAVTVDNKEFNILTDMPLDAIKADRNALLAKIIIKEGPYGQFGVFRMSEVLEEF
jgi:hypothetical protein